MAGAGRAVQVHFFVTRHEADMIRARARRAGMTASAYMREACLGGTAPDPLYENRDLRSLHLELRRAGSNLNQVARSLNACGRDGADARAVVLAAQAVERATDAVSIEMASARKAAFVPRSGANQDGKERDMEEIIKQTSSNQSAIAMILRANAAGDGYHAKHDDERPVVEEAARQAAGTVIDCGRSEVFHARAAMESVAHQLEATGSGDAAEARRLREALDDETAEAASFFGLVTRNWTALGDYTYTYRLLMDIVLMADGWPEDETARAGLESAAKTVMAGRAAQ